MSNLSRSSRNQRPPLRSRFRTSPWRNKKIIMTNLPLLSKNPINPIQMLNRKSQKLNSKVSIQTRCPNTSTDSQIRSIMKNYRAKIISNGPPILTKTMPVTSTLLHSQVSSLWTQMAWMRSPDTISESTSRGRRPTKRRIVKCSWMHDPSISPASPRTYPRLKTLPTRKW